MLLLNIEYIPGKEIQALGLAKGSVVQSKHFGKDFMAGMKTLVGGEIQSYTEMLVEMPGWCAGLLWALAALCAALIIPALRVLKIRFQEIEGGELDAASQY